VILGDGDLGPDWINSRAPFHGDPWRADHTEAYVHLNDGCAACVAGLEGQFSPIWHALHSSREEEDFVDVFNALHNATELRSQVIADLQPPISIKVSSTLWSGVPLRPILRCMRSCWSLFAPLFPGQFGKAFHHFDGVCGSLKATSTRSRVQFNEAVQLRFCDQHDCTTTIEVCSTRLTDLLNDDSLCLSLLEPPAQRSLSRRQAHFTDAHLVSGGDLHLTMRGVDHGFQPNFIDVDLAQDLPQFLHQLQRSFRERGLQLGPDAALHMRTWYIHHCDHDRCYAPRFVELEGNPASWSNDIAQAWQDLVLRDLPLSFHLVHPDLPRWTHDQPAREIHADLIVAQGDPNWHAGLLLVFPGPHIPSFELAASLPRFINGNDLVRIAQAEFWLHNARCRVTHGWHEIPLLPERPHPTEDGQSFVLAFTPNIASEGRDDQTHYDEAADDVSLMATVHHPPHGDPSSIVDWPEVVQDDNEAQDEVDSQTSEGDIYESDYTVAEADEHLPWQSVAVFDTEAHSARGRVPFAPYEAFFRRVRAIIGLRHHDVSRIVQITPTPDDLSALVITPLLILRQEDFEEGDFRRAALVDVEHHGSQWTTPVATDRFVIKLPDVIHRANFLAPNRLN